ncbi:c2h2 transcription factor [Stemphylium lycopersici]|nr:c2h2 transcription factor [Stemphylium lycopersici]
MSHRCFVVSSGYGERGAQPPDWWPARPGWPVEGDGVTVDPLHACSGSSRGARHIASDAIIAEPSDCLFLLHIFLTIYTAHPPSPARDATQPHSHLKPRRTTRPSPPGYFPPLPFSPLPSPTAKLDSYEHPPPLTHSPRESTAASTPITTPVEQPSSPQFGRVNKDASASLVNLWHRKPQELVASRQPDSDLLFEDAGDCSFPLFPEEPQVHSGFADMATASPIDIQTPPRYGSNSPPNQTSNLTSALKQAEAQPELATTPGLLNPNNFEFSNGRPSISDQRHPSISMLGSSFYGNSSARPITMKDRGRRESTNMGSFAGGMSWGGHSVGSWIRDDIMMGTSPAPFVNNSPSFHSSSYLPKMEAAFMKDFTCCGLTLASLHDLLQHFEETHANAPAARPQQPPQNGFTSSSGGAPTNSIAPSQTQGDPSYNAQNGFQSRSASVGAPRQRIGSVSRSNLSTVQDMDSLDDMDMDDINFDTLGPIDEQQQQQQQQQPMQHFPVQNQFSQTQNQNQQPNLNVNVNLANNMQNHQGMRTSTPTTPSASQQFNLQNNPTVSSVNTPTMGTMPMANHNLTSPESSHPGTPAELDMDFGGFNPMMGMDMGMSMGMNFGNGNGNFGMGAFDNNGTIDQPGKRLFSKQGGGLSQAQLQAALKNYQLSGNDQSEMARRLREQQLLNGASIPQFPFPEEVKPFRCPVIGCEKAYKNQNGLKYHKQHGHQNQQLKENDDGTFSIVDPLTSIPYPGTVGMEKEKPYRCEVCGKRYKNLNGLKYHRSHAPHCNPELAMQKLGLTGNLQNLQNANVAGAGMGGIDPSMF